MNSIGIAFPELQSFFFRGKQINAHGRVMGKLVKWLGAYAMVSAQTQVKYRFAQGCPVVGVQSISARASSSASK